MPHHETQSSLMKKFTVRMQQILLLSKVSRTSLVVQWWTIHLPMQGTLVQSLVGENFTCWGAAKPVYCNCWAPESGACAPQQEKPLQSEACTPQGRVAPRCPSHPPKLEKAQTKTSTGKRKQNPKSHTEQNKKVSRLLKKKFYFILAAAVHSLSPAAASRLSSCILWSPELVLRVLHRLSCPKACGKSSPD